jgi:hypothetical protein
MQDTGFSDGLPCGKVAGVWQSTEAKMPSAVFAATTQALPDGTENR